MTPYESEPVVPDVTERDTESTMSAIDCIAACRLDELYLQIACVDMLCADHHHDTDGIVLFYLQASRS